MTTVLVQKLAGVKDLKQILDTAAKELGEALSADSCQIVLTNPLDPNITAVCDYRSLAEAKPDLVTTTFPLVLNAGGIGAVRVVRKEKVTETETNSMRIILGELADLLRFAQINDVVQRETFRDNFLSEINSVMAYSLGIGDALFMVVNILGKVLHVSRCLFICTDDTQAGWKCYEFWQQDKVQSCQQCHWPTTDSSLVAQVLLARHPLQVFEGQRNCHISPVQEELELINVRSLLGVGLRSQDLVHGCVILQQCDYRRAWTRSEVDMVQHIADKVADALVKLPAEKRAREPIMQLHQRIVAQPGQGAGKSVAAVMRQALKGAFGQEAIPAAMTTASAQSTVQRQGKEQALETKTKPIAENQTEVAKISKVEGKLSSTFGKSTSETPTKPASKEQTAISPDQALKSVFDLGPKEEEIAETPAKEQAVTHDPFAALDIEEFAESTLLQSPAAPSAAAAEPIAAVEQEIVAPEKKEEKSAWGDLDAIPTPSKGSGKTGLRAVTHLTRGKLDAQVANNPTSNLAISFLQKEKALEDEGSKAKSEFIEGPPLAIDEQKAQEKFDQLLASPDPTSDYVFATPGLDTRALGRIDGWIAEIEAKDKYVHGHACQVAKYACAIASKSKLSEADIQLIRQAALVHDVGKLGAAASILQKRDEDLSDPELIAVMSHPIDGAELLSSFPDLEQLAPIVRAHHEEFDGNGYPQGLKGEEIPLAARIIYLANSYHGLVSEMCYGPGISPAQAQAELLAGEGKQYDPTLLKAFLECLQEEID